MSKGKSNYTPPQMRAAWMNKQHPIGAKVQANNAKQSPATTSTSPTSSPAPASTPAAAEPKTEK